MKCPDGDLRRDIPKGSPPWGRYHTHAPSVRCDPVLISRQYDSDCRPAGRLHADSELTRLLACSIEISVMQPPRSEWAENDWAVSIIAARSRARYYYSLATRRTRDTDII